MREGRLLRELLAAAIVDTQATLDRNRVLLHIVPWYQRRLLAHIAANPVDELGYDLSTWLCRVRDRLNDNSDHRADVKTQLARYIALRIDFDGTDVTANPSRYHDFWRDLAYALANHDRVVGGLHWANTVAVDPAVLTDAAFLVGHYPFEPALRTRHEEADLDLKLIRPPRRRTLVSYLRASLAAHPLETGLSMSLTAIMLAAATSGTGDQGLNIAAIAAAAVPTVGAAMSAVPRSELSEIANTNLRRMLWAGQGLAFAAVAAFVVSVGVGVSGLVSDAATVYTALSGGVLGGVSLIVSGRTKDALSLAVQVEMINAIEDPRERDRVRAKLAMASIDGTRRVRSIRPRGTSSS
ncbi:hypothetical protein QX204_17115 [Nocardia sp. PE-7]|uniref:hypothetical protein n=1 Tax=Nocardia sp. PE-7 TaxID=3058426 RepID=UPI002659796C|nr:hypothetical protein [Nocardia sp. PE-7]WKG13095.1 hypothetical protein QX204_17115 [Nocardia sp. PE-7]